MSLPFTLEEHQHCLICSGKVDTCSRDSVHVFEDQCVTSSKRSVVEVISEILKKNIEKDTAHSHLICKRCFDLIDELDQLEQRAVDIKNELTENYTNAEESANKKLIMFDENFIKDDENSIKDDENSIKDDENDEESNTSLNDNSSSDSTVNEIDKNQLRSLADIEIELQKMHSSNDENDDNSASEDQIYSNVEIIDIIKADKNKEKNNISSRRTDKEDDKPIILRKRDSQSSSNSQKIAIKNKLLEELPPVVSRDGEFYTCLLCEGDETVCGIAKAIIQHLRTNHETRLYICDICGQDFRKRNELSTHLDKHVATEEGDFQCETCNRIFSNLRLFRIHKRMHYPQNKSWTCEVCGKRYSSKNLLDEHMNVHTGVRPYICKLCGKDFASKYTFKAHEKTHEVRPRPFECPQCHKSFLTQQNLTQHERTHSGTKEYTCNICSKQFTSIHNLEVHSIVHSGYKPFICNLCGKAFARKAEIRDHERTHTGERPYQCEFCGATFSQRSNLQSHKRATHYDDKRYKCEQCGKGFKRRRLLDYHIKAAHTGERPYKCPTCSATFVYPEHFKKHRRIHTGEKPFLCEVCGKAFNSRDNRNAHRFIHSDKKPYECLVCGAGFMRKPFLYEHMQMQGHLNDTIVVNQPRLTTDDDQIITVNADGEMEIVDSEKLSSLQALHGIDEETSEDAKLFITEHVFVNDNFEDSKTTFIIDDKNEENIDESNTVEHIIISGQPFQFTNDSEDGEATMEESGDVLNEEYHEVSTEMFKNGHSEIIQTADGPVHLVKVRIPKEGGEEEEAWIKIVN